MLYLYFVYLYFLLDNIIVQGYCLGYDGSLILIILSRGFCQL